jgi:hypothetical protein
MYNTGCGNTICISLSRLATTAGTQEVLVRKRLSANTSTNHNLTLTCDTPGVETRVAAIAPVPE